MWFENKEKSTLNMHAKNAKLKPNFFQANYSNSARPFVS